jgi:hypothetical protein
VSVSPVSTTVVGKNTGETCDEGSAKDLVEPQDQGQTKEPESDILGTPGRTILVPTDDRRVRYGTVGTGLDLGRLVWPKDQHKFSSQTVPIADMVAQLPGRSSQVKELGPAGGIKKNVLRTNPVDVLLIDQIQHPVWRCWLESVRLTERPEAIIWFQEAEQLARDSEGPMNKGVRKSMQKLGYQASFWLMNSDDYGAALVQGKVCSIYHRRDLRGKRKMLWKPRPMDLPVRDMSNLLKPVGIPRKAYCLEKETMTVDKSYLPCKVLGRIRQEAVFERDGPMPDHPHVWIRSERGIRRLQHEELAKAKGVPPEWLKGPETKPLRQTLVEGATCLHLWTAAMDGLRSWMEEEAGSNSERVRPSTNPSPVEGWSSQSEDDEYEWNWKVPDLRKGGDWHKARVASLKRAIGERKDGNQLFLDGLKALDIHRENYTDEGPKWLQLLWWEFPEEHHEALREGCRMNFLITPEGELQLNSKMDEAERIVAGKFVDELKSLGILAKAEGPLKANCALFCVEKGPKQPDEKRCIADMKKGGQNDCIGKDPTFLVRSEDILPHLYPGGWTAIADASKYFHNFKTHPDERLYLGCIHPVTGEELVYVGLPMGSASSPSIACRMGNSVMRLLKSESPAFQGKARENTWRKSMSGRGYDKRLGHGRVRVGTDGLPVALIRGMVDDFLVHGPTKKKCGEGFSAFMDLTVRLGIICQRVKTKPPAQQQIFCGMNYDTRGVPTLRIPEEKITRGIATIEFLVRQNKVGRLSRLAVAVGNGFLQSLVESTPARQGQTYLRKLYDKVHELEEMFGKAMYYTDITLSEECIEDLRWWTLFLRSNTGNPSRAGTAGSLTASWGDGSGTGTGGTYERLREEGVMQIWMGTWAPHVKVYDSNWRELRTLLGTLERIHQEGRSYVRGGTLFYFTDNSSVYFIIKGGSSRSPELHKLARTIKMMEIELGCRLEPIHVPGLLMIDQGTDGQSRGMWLAPARLSRSSIMESSLALGGTPFSPSLALWALMRVGLPLNTTYQLQDTLSDWSFERVYGKTSLWLPVPEVARQALVSFLDIWVEGPTRTDGIFLIPRIMQKDWGYICKHVLVLGEFYPGSLPENCSYDSHIPFVLLYIPRHIRSLPVPRLVSTAPPPLHSKWHTEQADHLRGL